MTENLLQARSVVPSDNLPTALALGVLSATLAAAFVLFHWTLALAGGLLVLGLAAANCEWFLLLVIFLIPVSWSLGSAGTLISGLPSYSGIDAMQAVRWLAIGGFFAGATWRGEPNLVRQLRSPFTPLSLAFGGAVLLSSVLGTPGMRFSSLARGGTHLIDFLGFFFLIVAWASSRQRFERIVNVLFLSMLLTAFFGIIQFVVGGYTALWHFLFAAAPLVPTWTGRASSFYSEVNEFAQYLCFLLPFALGCAVLGEGWWKRIGRWAFFVGTVALVCTQSHGGLLAFAAVMASAALFLMRTWKRRLLAFAAALSAVAAIYAVVHLAGLTHASQLQEVSLVGRLLLWSAAWHFFLISPVYGVGWGNFQVLHTSQFHAGSVASVQGGVQNLYLQLLSETGLIGFSTFFMLLYAAFKAARKALRSGGYPLARALAFGVIGSTVALLVQGITEAQLEVPQVGAVLWVLLALFVVSERVGSGSEPRATRLQTFPPSGGGSEFQAGGEPSRA